MLFWIRFREVIHGVPVQSYIDHHGKMCPWPISLIIQVCLKIQDGGQNINDISLQFTGKD